MLYCWKSFFSVSKTFLDLWWFGIVGRMEAMRVSEGLGLRLVVSCLSLGVLP